MRGSKRSALVLTMAGWCAVLAAGPADAVTVGMAASQAPAEVDDRRIRREALIGLARVARDTGNHDEAEQHFRAAATLSPLDTDLQREYFWVAAEVNASRAMTTARALADAGAADVAVFERWLLLARERHAHDEVMAAARRAERTLPASARWPRHLGESHLVGNRPREAAEAFARAAAAADGTTDDHAMQALALERAGDARAASDVWKAMPDAVRRQRPEWQASHLRTGLAVDGPKVTAVAFSQYLDDHPGDAGTRALAVEAWAEIGEFARALATLGPLTGGPLASRWVRREGELAALAGDTERARSAFARLNASSQATPEDRWRLVELSASQSEPAQLVSGLAALRSFDTPCATRALSVADMSDADAVFAAVALALPDECPLADRLVLRAARFFTATGRDGDAERLLQHRLAQPTPPEAVVLALSEQWMHRGAVAEADALLRQRLTSQPEKASAALVEAAAWARHANGHSADAWALLHPLLPGANLAVDEQVRWAGLALAAGAHDTATELARAGLGSAQDTGARHVLATVAGAEGRPGEAYEWLAPVAGQIAEPGAASVWLDAVALVKGPAPALAAAAALPEAATAHVDVSARRAVYAAQTGDVAAAAAWHALVAAAVPARAAVLDLEIAVASGAPRRVLRAIDVAELGAVGVPTLSVFISAALDAGAWDEAAAGVAAWTARELDEDWAVRKHAHLELARDGRLSPALRADLLARWAAGERDDEVAIRLAQDDLANGQHDEALARLRWPDAVDDMTLAVREVAAEALLERGAMADVVHLVTDGRPVSPSMQLAHARALLAMGDRFDAHGVLLKLAPAARRPAAWHLLAETAPEPGQQLAVLEEAIGAHPDVPDLWAALASARLNAAMADEARAAAAEAIARDPAQLDAWRVRLQAAPAADAVTRSVELHEAGGRFAGSPEALLDLAGAALTGGPLDADSAATVEGWIEQALDVMPLQALQVRTRLAVAAGRWDQAIAATARSRDLTPDDEVLQHLEARLHAWGGRHADARRLFEAWLRAEVAHAEGWREYARLLSWMQDTPAAARAYAVAEQLHATPAVAAERETKAALARGAWRRAAAEADLWLTAEPASVDAAVDRAVALDRAGDFDEAAAAFAVVSTRDAAPDYLRAAAVRYNSRQRAAGTVGLTVDSATGFGAQRLLEQRLMRADAGSRFGVGRRHHVFADVGSGELDGGSQRWDVTQGRAGAALDLGRSWQTEIAGGWAAPVGAQTLATGRAALAGVPTDGLRLVLAAERRPFWENGATVERGLAATGMSGGLQWQPSARWHVSAASGAHRVSDGNLRTEMSGMVARRTAHGPRDIEWRSSIVSFGYRDPADLYFAPGRFMRTDLEADVRHWFGRPRVDGELRPSLAGSTGIGVDSRGARYALAGARLMLPLGGPWALAGEGRWVRSHVFKSTQASVWLQLGGR